MVAAAIGAEMGAAKTAAPRISCPAMPIPAMAARRPARPKTATANELKQYNAAHASAMGLSHASDNSIVGMLGNYAEALADGDQTTIDNASLALFGADPNQDIVDAVDDLLTEGKKHEDVDRSLSN